MTTTTTKKTMLTLLSVLLMVTFLLPPTCAQESVTKPSVQVRPGATASRDPFAEDRNKAVDAENAWRNAQQRLDDSLTVAEPCKQAQQLIDEVKNAALAALSYKAEYYRKHLEYQQNTSVEMSKISADRAGLRQEIERDLRNAERLQSEMGQRRQSLDGSGKGAELDKAKRALDQLLANTEARVNNLRTALLHWNEAEDFTRQARDLARQRAEAVRQAQQLLLSESSLWEAYYSARSARQMLTRTDVCGEFTPFAARTMD